MYGLKQSPRTWFKQFSTTLNQAGYNQGQVDRTLFIKHVVDGRKTILIVYVDDIIITGDNIQEIEELKGQLQQVFEMKDLGQLRYFLGMEVAKNKECIFIS